MAFQKSFLISRPKSLSGLVAFDDSDGSDDSEEGLGEGLGDRLADRLADRLVEGRGRGLLLESCALVEPLSSGFLERGMTIVCAVVRTILRVSVL